MAGLERAELAALLEAESPTPPRYLELLRGFDDAAHGADPAARIVLGGLFPTPRGGITMDDFMSALYRGHAANLFDAAAIHPYAANPQDALARTGELRDVMDHSGDEDGGIWISEVGWASGGEPSGLTVGPERQAEYLTQTFELMAREQRAARARGGDLVFAQRCAGFGLARALRPVHSRRPGKALVAGVRRPDGRRPLAQVQGLAPSSNQNPPPCVGIPASSGLLQSGPSSPASSGRLLT